MATPCKLWRGKNVNQFFSHKNDICTFKHICMCVWRLILLSISFTFNSSLLGTQLFLASHSLLSDITTVKTTTSIKKGVNFLSHNNPCFQCNISITNFLVLRTCEIRFHGVIGQSTGHMYSYAKILKHG